MKWDPIYSPLVYEQRLNLTALFRPIGFSTLQIENKFNSKKLVIASNYRNNSLLDMTKLTLQQCAEIKALCLPRQKPYSGPKSKLYVRMTLAEAARHYGVTVADIEQALLAEDPPPPPIPLVPTLPEGPKTRRARRARSKAALILPRPPKVKTPRQRTEEDRLKVRANWLQKKYGITIEEYDAICTAQDGRCAICGVTPEESSTKRKVRYLDVDHCHITGAVRGLLCNRCNSAIGRFNDDSTLLTKAVEYLQKYA